jgi:segregation and condensation protein B
MSLKAKIEAVIYASEEPVTLAQLMGLLGEEAQAELDAREAEQATLALETAADGEEPTAEAVEAETPTEPASGDDQAVAEEAAPQEATPKNVEAAAAAAASTKQEQEKAIAAEGKARERRLRTYFRELLEELTKDYVTSERGLEVREVAGGFRLATKPEYHDAVRGFVKHLKPPLKLSLQALETLAVIAYKQPVTAPEISEIRGVDSGGVLGSLIARKLIQTAGRKQVIGRPMLYKTSKEFLVRFGLKDISELPSIEEFEKMAGELNDAVQEEIPMGDEREEGGSPALDEINSAPDNNEVHESPEEMISDRSNGEEGMAREHADPSEVEPMADVHEAQADGVPDVNPADNIVVDGRNVGGPHTDHYEEDEPEESPEHDAEVQSGEKES